jgi:putative YphP/YqiW family bacilliredoxin
LSHLSIFALQARSRHFDATEGGNVQSKGNNSVQESPGGKTMYPELMVIPMREELTKAGVVEARTSAEVDAALAKPGTTMLVVNSICGCAAGKMRPGVRLALQHGTKPDQTITVFAGQDREATERARSYFQGHPPTSPAIAILRDGQLIYLMQRSAIETSTAPAIAQELTRAFDHYCAETVV